MKRQWKRWRPGDHPRAGWLVPLVPLVLALALVAAACGESSGGDGVATASGGEGSRTGTDQDGKKKNDDPQQAGLDYARCMREHGVDVPDPQPGEGGFIRLGPAPAGGASSEAPEPSPEFEAADKACRHFLEDLIQDGGGPADPEAQDRALKFAQCMREHGVNMPDPQFEGGAISVKIEGVDPQSETFNEAQKACAEFFGPPGGGLGVQPRSGS